MESSDLAYFLAVASSNSIGRAAEILETAQSNVSSRIHRLEQNLGQPLFKRHSRGVTLTDAGQRLLPYASEVRALLIEARRSLSDQAEEHGSLNIGSMETTVAARLGELLPRYVSAHPGIHLTLETGTSEEMLEKVIRQELDGAFVCGPVTNSRLRKRRVFREELMILAGPGVTSLDAIAAVNDDIQILVMRRGCAYRRRLEHILLSRGIGISRVFEYGTVDAILSCAAAGLGISLLPWSYVAPYCERYICEQIRLPENEGAADTYFVWPARSYVARPLQGFLAFLADVGVCRETYLGEDNCAASPTSKVIEEGG